MPACGAGVLAVGGPGPCPARLAMWLCSPRDGERNSDNCLTRELGTDFSVIFINLQDEYDNYNVQERSLFCL